MKYTLLGAIAATLIAGQAGAVSLVTNGSFESSVYTANHEFGSTYGQVQGVTGWTSTGYSLYFIGGTQTTVNATNRFGADFNYFYDTLSTLSPDGGNFVALDGDSSIRGPLSQTITGLTPGAQYAVSFYWGGAQLRTATGATTDQLTVSFGDATQSTAVISNVSGGFTGWQKQTFTFTAGAASQVLSFLSIGTPDGLPPIAVLDGVSVAPVPEPATWALLVVGFGLVGFAARRRVTAVAA